MLSVTLSLKFANQTLSYTIKVLTAVPYALSILTLTLPALVWCTFMAWQVKEIYKAGNGNEAVVASSVCSWR